ncbi:MAG: energy transducer TonB [Lentimicrobiaceae bacterium]|nr:energy transducer TonB [Lentimicrobiaceae bacterium]
MSSEAKNKMISSFVTVTVMALVVLLLFVLGLYSQVPPPEPRKMILIELTSGGGGGGGSNMPESSRNISGAAPHLVTQDTEDAPVLASNPTPSTTTSENAVSSEPKPDPGAAYRPGKGGGSGGGTGTGTGTGAGMGMGSGEGAGAGSGRGIGYGSGNRAYVNIPDVNISENGVVYVQVHVTAQGTVVDARIVSTSKYPTNITNAKILDDCLARARSAKYVTGKEELRIIVFK